MKEWQRLPVTAGRGHSITGTVLRLPGVESPQLGNERDLYVYLPPTHAPGNARFPVIYMQDGQNLFDRALAFAGNEWQVDETMEACSTEGLEAIVVGIANSGNARINEYAPFRHGRLGGGDADRYLAFLFDTVKPRIDGDFQTLSDGENTLIAGSSMGGLLALYAFFQQPLRFGGAAALSPSLWFGKHAILRMITHAERTSGRLYLDMGSREGPGRILDVVRLRRLLLRKGFRRGIDLLSVIEPGGRHDEKAWARRFPNAVRFLLRRVMPETSRSDPAALRVRPRHQ